MNRHPPQPLDAEERALAAQLPRPHGRSEPGPELDARILAAAQAATQPKPTARRRLRSWIAPTAVAASLMLAVGLAWQLRAPPAPEFPVQAADATATASATESVSVAAVEAPPPQAEMQKPTTQARMVEAPPTPAPTAAVAKPATASAIAADTAEVATAPMAAPPPAPPAPAPMIVAQDAAAMPQTTEPARAQAPAMAKARASDVARETITASGTAAARAEQDEADRAANAAMFDTIASDDPGEDVPPATADSPQVRDAWLRRIGDLLKQGKTEDAKASLAEFKRRYPDANLPPELRKLDP